MECSVCDRAYSKSRKPICTSCAQVTLYGSRLHQIESRLARKKAHAHAEAVARPGNDGVIAALPQDADWDAITGAVKHQIAVRSDAEHTRLQSRITAVTEQAEILRKQVEDYKQYVKTRRQENTQRRVDLTKERNELAQRRLQILDPMKILIRKTSQRLDKTQQRTTDARAYICAHASRLCGLSDRHRESAGQYTLGGLLLPNLKELGGSNVPGSSRPAHPLDDDHHEHVNACLENICHLVGLWCHYLSVRLPAEIIMPHADFPHSAILPEKSSYKAFDLPYPGVLGGHGPSPSTSRVLQEQRSTPRARLLHLDRPLSQLAKEDSKTFGLFVEGCMLLAWDVAWLCRSQGIATINSFDDICNIGKNLTLLSRAQEASFRSRPTLDRRDTGRTDTTTRSSKQPSNTPTFGAYSHGRIRNSLAGHQGAALMHDWRLAQPHRVVDKLRNFLLTEITGAEWDVLSNGDLDDEREDEVAVLVGGARRTSRDDQSVFMSTMSVAPPGALEPQAKPENGWMKVRGRNAGA